MKKRSNLLFLCLALVFTMPALIGLFHPGFFPTDDGNWMVIRFSAFYEALRNGQFPVRFLPRLNNGYGYPVADFLYPLFMYLGIPIHILRINFIDTIKIILGLSIFLSSVFTFLWLRKLFDNISSFVGATLYVLFPYHLYDVYKRGSVGEAVSLTVLPFLFWQTERKSLVWTSIGIAFLILAHNTLAVMFMPLVFLYMILNVCIAEKRKELLLFYLKSLVLGFSMSSFFWVPALYDLQYTVFFKTTVSQWSNYFSPPGLVSLSFIFVFLAFFVLIVFGKINIKKYKLEALVFIIGILSVFLAFPQSYFVWRFLPVSFIQFPFRFLSLAIVSTSFLSAFAVSVLKGKIKLAFAIITLVLIFVSAWPYLFPKSYQMFPDTFYSTNQDSTTVRNEYMPKWVKQIPESMAREKVTVVSGRASVQNLLANGNKASFSLNAFSSSVVQFNTIYYPGWTVEVDKKTVPVSYNNNSGLIRFSVSPGQKNVDIYFAETPIRIIFDLISLLGLAVLLLLAERERSLKKK